MIFKDYLPSYWNFVSTINLLLSTKHSITTVSEPAGLTVDTNFANQLKLLAF